MHYLFLRKSLFWLNAAVGKFLCPFALHYLRYAVTSFFHNLPHFSRGRQKSGTKSTSQNRRSSTKCKTPLLFVPLFWNPRKILSTFILFVYSHQTDHYQGDETEGFEREGLWDGEIGKGQVEREGVNRLLIVYAKPNKHERSQCHLQLLCWTI